MKFRQQPPVKIWKRIGAIAPALLLFFAASLLLQTAGCKQKQAQPSAVRAVEPSTVRV